MTLYKGLHLYEVEGRVSCMQTSLVADDKKCYVKISKFLANH